MEKITELNISQDQFHVKRVTFSVSQHERPSPPTHLFRQSWKDSRISSEKTSLKKLQTVRSNCPPIVNHPEDTVTSFQVDKPELVLGYPHLFNWLNHLLCYRQTVRIVWRRPLRESSSSLDQPPPGSQCISLPQVPLVHVAQTAAFHSMLVLSEYAGHLHNGRESLAKLFRTHPYKIQINNLIFKSKASQGLVIIICLENGGQMVLDVSQ